MAWERGYYYRAKKVNGRVVREYVGRGRVAELVAEFHAIRRAEREAAAADWRAEKARLDALDTDLAALSERADLAAAAALLAAGFHQHKRQWRRKRMGTPLPPAAPVPATAPANSEETAAIVKRARAGDETVLPALRALLTDAAAVDSFGGDFGWQAEQSLIRATVGNDLLVREALTRKLELLRAELAGPAPTPLERLLVERVAARWLQLHEADIHLAQREDKLTLAQADYHQRTRDRAHKRYLSSIKALALVRKLALPVLQVNIARQQVNVAGAAGGG